jgi:hypothetical protein
MVLSPQAVAKRVPSRLNARPKIRFPWVETPSSSRGRGRLQSLTELSQYALAAISGQEPIPELAAQVAEESRRLMDQLGDSGLQRVATWNLERYTNDEIPARLGCVTSTVERKLARIRSRWAKEIRDSAWAMTVDVATVHDHWLDSTELARAVDEACDRFEAAWRAGDRPRIEDW